jgi:hypothetical protein
LTGCCGGYVLCQDAILGQTEAALREADIVLFLYDGREGVTTLDEHFAKWLRRYFTLISILVSFLKVFLGRRLGTKSKVDAENPALVKPPPPVLLIANKCETMAKNIENSKLQ